MQKQVKVSHIHANPHRRRHYALLAVSLVVGVAVIGLVLAYQNNMAISRAVATQTIASVFGKQTQSNAKVSSTYGFTALYDAKRYYASAADGATGGLFVGDELSTDRAYDAVRFSEQAAGPLMQGSSIMISYYPHDSAPADTALLEQRYIADKQTNPTQLQKGTTVQKKVGDITFQRTEWTRTVPVGAGKIVVTFVTYAANLNGHPLTVIAYQGSDTTSSADAFIESMTFTPQAASVTLAPSTESAAKHSIAVGLLDTVLGTQTAHAAAPNYTAAERVSATYGPAVVKVYNVIVADLVLDGHTLYKDYITGGTGSGFIISSDGYIATNGHVAVNDPKEVIIKLSLAALASGDSSVFEYLVKIANITDSDLAGVRTQDEAVKIVVKRLYDIPSSHFSFEDKQENIMVGLTEKQVDIEDLVAQTKLRKKYADQSTIKHAKLVSYDYGGALLPLITKEFTSSDVALLKIESGGNYPMVKLGVMADAGQGSNINIIGYPGVGSSSNGLVGKTATSATLTTGKVSSHKQDSGGREMIETDTEIGHGNSGGPAFNDDGSVVGIATYTSDTGNAGDGVLNYVRDIADFLKVADKQAVNYQTVSDTQKEWNKAIDLFYKAHYKSAAASFANVKQMYPDHPKVAEMIAATDKHIANGENIDEFPLVPVLIGAGVALLGTVVAVIFIVIHKKGHKAYVHGVNTGQIQPLAPGAAPQMVNVPQNAFIGAPQAYQGPSAPMQAIQQQYVGAQSVPVGQPTLVQAPQQQPVSVAQPVPQPPQPPVQ